MGSVIQTSYNTKKQGDFKTFYELKRQATLKENKEYNSHSILVWESHLGFVCKERLSSSTIGAKSNSTHTKKKFWLQEPKRGCVN